MNTAEEEPGGEKVYLVGWPKKDVKTWILDLTTVVAAGTRPAQDSAQQHFIMSGKEMPTMYLSSLKTSGS